MKMKAVSKEILDRLTRSKYIFIHGVQLLERQGPIKEGLALLAFHDSLEMMLRAIAEHFHAGLKMHEPFNSLLDKVEEGSNCQLTHRSALLQLNHARVSFKHYGLLPQFSDVAKFRNDLEAFLSNILHKAMGVEFTGLSLADLVTHRRARNWLKKAEDKFAEEKFAESVECTAASLAIFRKSQRSTGVERKIEGQMRAWRDGLRGGGQVDHKTDQGFMQLARIVDERIANLEEGVDWVASGVFYGDVERFFDLAPVVNLVGSGEIYFHRTAEKTPTREESLFCITFATEAIVKQQHQYRSDSFGGLVSRSKCRVVTESPVFLFLNEEKVEVIRTAQVGEELSVWLRGPSKEGYTTVLQDGDLAYVRSEALEEVK